jgi:hypothetical protein
MKKTIWILLILLLISGCGYSPSDEDKVDKRNVDNFGKAIGKFHS